MASSQGIFDALAADGKLSWDPGPSHNLWLNNLLQLGLVGTALLVASIAWIVRSSARAPDRYRDALLMALMVNAMTEPMLHEPAIAVLLLAGMAGSVSFAPRPARIEAPSLV